MENWYNLRVLNFVSSPPLNLDEQKHVQQRMSLILKVRQFLVSDAVNSAVKIISVAEVRVL
jgi:hypothetical protein